MLSYNCLCIYTLSASASIQPSLHLVDFFLEIFYNFLNCFYKHQFTGINSDLYFFIEVASPQLTKADSSSGQLQVKLIEVLKTNYINSTYGADASVPVVVQ